MTVLDQEKAFLAAPEGLSEIYHPAGTAPPRNRVDRVLFNSIFVLSIGTLLSTAWGLAYVYSGLDWNAKELKATRIGDLAWYPCPDVTTTLCAYHTVPMNWSEPRANETVSLALRMLPATVPVKDQLGYLFVNPGGPGGSGTEFVVRAGTALSTVVEGRYAILSWDPRGVNLTSPALDCFASSEDAARFTRDIEKAGLPFEARGTDDKNTAGALAWAQKVNSFADALDGACTTNGNQAILSASSTAFVVRDMVSILEALGEEKLSYWGFSYGTILGATFSAMFPHLVHRVALDGVSDSVSYTQNFWEWGLSGMDDTHKTYQGFLDSCVKSGPLGCALATNGTTSEQLEDRIHKLRVDLRDKPLAVPTSASGPGIVTASDIEYSIFHALYGPKTWPALAVALHDLENGNGRRIYELSNPVAASTKKHPSDNVFHRSMIGSMASTAAIMCTDTDQSALNDTSSGSVLRYTQDLGKRSVTGEIWALWTAQCSRWSQKAIETYRGPWTVATGLKKTNYPILFLSNTADPVTPLSAARSMSKGFGAESASLAIQNGFGHCSLAHPSLCTAKLVRAYFLEGKVPEYGTTCDSDPGYLFPHPAQAEAQYQSLSVENQKLYEALDILASEINVGAIGL